MSITWILAFIVFGLIYIAYVFYTIKFKYWKNRGVRYVNPVMFLGNLSFIMTKSAWQFFSELYQNYKRDEYVGIFLASQPALVVQTPELARRILVQDAANFQDRYLYAGNSDPLGSLNLFTIKVNITVIDFIRSVQVCLVIANCFPAKSQSRFSKNILFVCFPLPGYYHMV